MWSLTAHGFLGDVTAAEEFVAKLRDVFAAPESGTMGTSFSGPGVSVENFHLDPAADPADVQDQTPAAAVPAGGDTTGTSPADEPPAPPAVTGGEPAEDSPPAQG